MKIKAIYLITAVILFGCAGRHEVFKKRYSKGYTFFTLHHSKAKERNEQPLELVRKPLHLKEVKEAQELKAPCEVRSLPGGATVKKFSFRRETTRRKAELQKRDAISVCVNAPARQSELLREAYHAKKELDEDEKLLLLVVIIAVLLFGSYGWLWIWVGFSLLLTLLLVLLLVVLVVLLLSMKKK